MQLVLRLSENELNRLHNHAEQSLPIEAAALLFGCVHDTDVVVRCVELVQNIAESKTSFSVDPETEYKLLVEAEERGEDLVGIFHSHPAPPKPSASDLRNMRLNPVVWVISSKLTGRWESRAYILDDNNLDEVDLILT
ncbi:MAG: M67 family metallopeptidase [Candidatus Thorarchaeota archaeon]